jgi:YbbR domain-containing protein
MIRKLAQRIGWPVFALAAAFALWLTFVGSPEMVTTIRVLVVYENMPQDLDPAAELPDRISVEIQGPSARLRGFDESRASVTVDLASVTKPGEHTFTIDRSDIDLPAGVSVVRTAPSQIRLRFEHRTPADVPVNVRFAAPPPEGYRVAGQEVHPATLKIIGPESRVKRVASVETDPIDLSRAIGRARFQVHTYLAEPQVRFVSSPVVQVSVTLEKAAQGGAPSDGKATVRN